MDEGEFVNDHLRGTFGRRIYLNGSTQIGWFSKRGDKLHGYGKDSSNEGYYEEGEFKNS